MQQAVGVWLHWLLTVFHNTGSGGTRRRYGAGRLPGSSKRSHLLLGSVVWALRVAMVAFVLWVIFAEVWWLLKRRLMCVRCKYCQLGCPAPDHLRFWKGSPDTREPS